jgi:hypothetical protein
LSAPLVGPLGRKFVGSPCKLSTDPMTQIRRFREPLRLKDGRRLETLSDVEAFIRALPHQRQAKDGWQYAAHLLMNARRPMATDFVIDRLVRQLACALEAERLM